MNEMEILQQRVEYLEAVISDMTKSDRYTLQKNIQVFNGRNIQLATGTGTKIGTNALEKLGFWNATPIVQPSFIAYPAGGATADTQARVAINSVLDVLSDSGLMASS